MDSQSTIFLSLEYNNDGRTTQATSDYKYDELLSFACETWDSLTRENVIFRYKMPGGDSVLQHIRSNDDMKIAYALAIRRSIDVLKVYVFDKLANPIDLKSPRVSSKMDSTNCTPISDNTPHKSVESGASIVPLSNTISTAVAKRKLVQFWEKELEQVGQEFVNVQAFRDALTNYSISWGFNYRYIKNDRRRVTACCENLTCEWRVHAICNDFSTGTFQIKEFEKTHTCGGGLRTLDHPRASKKWVSSVITDKVKTRPLYLPTDIRADIRSDYGIVIPYYKAWWGKEEARKVLFGDEKLSFDKLRFYVDEVLKTNPGSHVKLEWDVESGRFERFFIAFDASIVGFRMGCRPLLFMDGTFLKSKYQGVLLGANGLNGNNEIFTLAFAVVDSETDSNWEWFMSDLKKILDLNKRYTFISDRCIGLANSILRMFPGHFHAYCLMHLEQNFKSYLSRYSKPARNK